jgi:hypothetical protein
MPANNRTTIPNNKKIFIFVSLKLDCSIQQFLWLLRRRRRGCRQRYHRSWNNSCLYLHWSRRDYFGRRGYFSCKAMVFAAPLTDSRIPTSPIVVFRSYRIISVITVGVSKDFVSENSIFSCDNCVSRTRRIAGNRNAAANSITTSLVASPGLPRVTPALLYAS